MKLRVTFVIVLLLFAATALSVFAGATATGLTGWWQVTRDGFGDPANYAAMLGVFNDKLYAGTLHGLPGGAQLWQMGPAGWQRVAVADGFGNSQNRGIDHLFVFEGSFYAGTDNRDTGGELWRSSNGTVWEPIVTGGFGDKTNGEIFRLAEYGGMIYATTWVYTSTHGAEIWRSDTGAVGSWSRAVSNGFGDAGNTAILSLQEYGGHLYAGTDNRLSGGEIWRSTDGASWERVSAPGFGDDRLYAVSALQPLGGYLYAAAAHKEGAPAQIWRCQACDGNDWKRVAGAFLNNDSRQGLALEVHDGGLYAGIGNSVTGLEVWRSSDGLTWEPANTPGFGNPTNTLTYWDNGLVVFEDRLYVATWNVTTGTQVWRTGAPQVFLPVVLR